MKRLYVGVTTNAERVVFRSADTPTRLSHGGQYAYVIGPFSTRRGASVMALHGRMNPHIQTVADAERIAARCA